MAVRDAPASTIGFGLTTIVLEAVLTQDPPVVVSVKVAIPVYPAGGVQVAFKFDALGLNVPPMPPSDHTPPVADPPTLPPKGAEVPL